MSGPARRLVLLLAGELADVTTARAHVSDQLGEWGIGGDRLEDAQLVVTELVANAVRHAHGAVEVQVRLDGVLEISVADGSGEAFAPRAAAVDAAANGRGLSMVGALAQDWGVEQRQDGKRVWCVLADHAPPPAPRSSGPVRRSLRDVAADAFGGVRPQWQRCVVWR